jgi:hypothetical protein
MIDKKHDDFDMTSGQLYEFTNKATKFVNSCSQDPRNEGYKIESSDPRLFARVEFCDGCGWAVNEGSDTYYLLFLMEKKSTQCRLIHW